MAGLSSKIRGLRFMQRAIDKAEKGQGEAEDKGTSAVADERGNETGTSDGWVAEAATSKCIVLRGGPCQPGTRGQRKGKLAFGRTHVEVEQEQIQTVTEQMRASQGGSKEGHDEPAGLKKRRAKTTKKSSKKRRP